MCVVYSAENKRINYGRLPLPTLNSHERSIIRIAEPNIQAVSRDYSLALKKMKNEDAVIRAYLLGLSIFESNYYNMLQALAANQSPIDPNCKIISVLIAEDHQEHPDYLKRVLLSSANQTFTNGTDEEFNQFEILIFFNHTAGESDPNTAKLKEVVKEFRERFTKVRIREVDCAFDSNEKIIGSIRAVANDLALYLATEGIPTIKNLALCRHDADICSFGPNYFQNLINEFSDPKVTHVRGPLYYSPFGTVRNPHVLLTGQLLNLLLPTSFGGPNSAIRASFHCLLDSYDPKLQFYEDRNFDFKVINFNKLSNYFLSVSAGLAGLLYVSSRRTSHRVASNQDLKFNQISDAVRSQAVAFKHTFEEAMKQSGFLERVMYSVNMLILQLQSGEFEPEEDPRILSALNTLFGDGNYTLRRKGGLEVSDDQTFRSNLIRIRDREIADWREAIANPVLAAEIEKISARLD